MLKTNPVITLNCLFFRLCFSTGMPQGCAFYSKSENRGIRAFAKP